MTDARPNRECLMRLGGAGCLAVLLLAMGSPAEAYIGPGAGFALVSSFAVMFVTIMMAFVAIMIWPFRKSWRLFKSRGGEKPWVRRMIVVGFDGQDPRITERLMKEGKLPNFARLKEMGCYTPLGTTYPAISPVAWSSFSTGTQPAKHNMFDFLDRDRRTYLPILASTRIGSVERFWKIGKYRIPRDRPELTLLRKSRPFWSILGDKYIWSTVLRVPITFPPERFYGAQLSAMCAPDLLGTQGTFLLYSTRPPGAAFKEGGQRFPLKGEGDRFETTLQGPPNAFLEGNPPLETLLIIERDRAAGLVRMTVGDERFELKPKLLSDWTPLKFKAAPGISVSGICRMMVTEMGDHLSLYVTPLNIDPENPAMPISHPGFYSTYLAKKVGPYATLGLAEDTWALNEGVIDDGTFLKLAYDIDAERKEMFFSSLDKLRTGTLSCVFDATDRIQHMFWRYYEKDHPAARGKDPGEFKNAVEDIYLHNDKLVGEVIGRLEKGDLLMVISDHGFTSFRRGCNLNAWLKENGYLFLKEGASGTSEWLRDVDWSRTRAYALGLTGMFLNLKGREASGIVEPGEEAEALKAELVTRLSGLKDTEKNALGINELFQTAKLYQGPYLEGAPDFVVGYAEGYRASWDCATGVVATPVFEDNLKAWSGDHCVDPRLVPGIFFCNYPIDRAQPTLVDIAPTALRIFGQKPAPHMDGHTLFETDPLAKHASGKAAA
ncbi:MAG: alkaline phosphatase family protein [Vicinamibacteria bacterium]